MIGARFLEELGSRVGRDEEGRDPVRLAQPLDCLDSDRRGAIVKMIKSGRCPSSPIERREIVCRRRHDPVSPAPEQPADSFKHHRIIIYYYDNLVAGRISLRHSLTSRAVARIQPVCR